MEVACAFGAPAEEAAGIDKTVHARRIFFRNEMCEEHSWMRDRAGPHAGERAFDIAGRDPPNRVGHVKTSSNDFYAVAARGTFRALSLAGCVRERQKYDLRQVGEQSQRPALWQDEQQ